MKYPSLSQVQRLTLAGLFVIAVIPAIAAAQQGLKPLRFLPAVKYDSGGFEPGFVAVADVNGDGKMDLLVANTYFSNTIGVLLGNGDGSFQPAATYDSGGGFPVTIVPIDLNGDGRIDLVVANQTPCYTCVGGGIVAVLLGNGDGTFQTAVTYDSGGEGFDNNGIGPAELAVADVNGDGKPDIVVSNCGPKGVCHASNRGLVGVLLGKGNGTFQQVRTSPGVTRQGTGLAVADVNGDGKPDVIVTSTSCKLSSNCSLGTVGVLLGNGDGTFQTGMTYPWGGWTANGLAVGDFNGDGTPDIVVGGCDSGNCLAANGEVGILIGNGDGTFQKGIPYKSGGGTFVDGLAVGDVDEDGKQDVVTVNFAFGMGTVGVLLGNGDGTFRQAVTFPTGGDGNYSVAIQDVNGDGRPDLLVTSSCCGGGSDGVVGVLLANVQHATTTTLTSSKPSSVYGDRVTFTAQVTGSGPAIPTGQVGFRWADGSLGAAKLNANGVAVLTRSTINAGSYAMTAVYGGDANNLGSSSAAVNEVVQPAASAASITSSVNPSAVGQTVTFTATIASPTVTPSGPVTFSIGKTVLGSVQLSGGKAQFMTSSLPAGSDKVTVTFYGDSNIAQSTASVVQTVQ